MKKEKSNKEAIERAVLDLFWQAVKAKQDFNPYWKTSCDTFTGLVEQAAAEFKK